ncbi:Casein kinase 1-like protein 9 [Psilocybe cubensis]|uniref:Casein kinase 1-like protein 9 n=1 Tax=Psilocybe cubensis TaxID=181762 RepID=A0ACB8GYK0_PSICU|nr:Casein kinase 1-like protein 9 [Psilocybe cubensis]KAH9480462.1 Casein kinase 1-like protein 9 [Psilocybe cubensis]
MPVVESNASNSEDYSSEGSETGSEGSIDAPPPPIPKIVANWWLNENLGSGYSGSIFKATHLHTHQVVALKVQYVNHECPTNRYERHLYPLLQGGVGMPKLYAAGVQGAWDYLAIDLLGPSLDSLYRKSGRDTMDLRTVCSIAIQLIKRLQFMHHRGVLHRDIQLGNCVIGLPPNDKIIYMIDFGFSKRFIDPYTGRHIPDMPSRRDDLEAAALMFIHLLTPRGLSWTRNGVPKTTDAHNRLKAEKRKATPEHLCRGLPSEFEEFLSYTRRLAFKETPDYDLWANKFRELAIDEGFKNPEDFIWPPPPMPAASAKTINTPLRMRTPAIPRDEMADILNNLTNLNLGAQPILGDRTNIQEALRRAKEDAQFDSTTELEKQRTQSKDTIVISSDSESGPAPIRYQAPKALRLNQLARRGLNATDNAALSKLVKEFVDVLQMNSSRTLTREAFTFLDVLYKQLDDPSVFVTPQRHQSFNEQVPEKEPAHVKLGVVARLRREVMLVQSNKALAALVADFAKVTNKSTGRTVTKDGFAFLEGLSERLKALQ